MTTDNRTNEQIVTDLYPFPHDHNRRANALTALTALETAGRLVGEPTEAQVEAAAKALEKFPLNLITRSEALDAARAALVAVAGTAPRFTDDQIFIGADAMSGHAIENEGASWDALLRVALTVMGTAPQAESGSRSRIIDLAEKWADEKLGGYIARTSFMQGVRFALEVSAAPVLPSSTVDIEKLSEIIHLVRHPECSAPWFQPQEDRDIARAVAEWLNAS